MRAAQLQAELDAERERNLRLAARLQSSNIALRESSVRARARAGVREKGCVCACVRASERACVRACECIAGSWSGGMAAPAPSLPRSSAGLPPLAEWRMPRRRRDHEAFSNQSLMGRVTLRRESTAPGTPHGG